MTADLPLYIEISPLLAMPLAGIGRFVVRLIENLASRTSMRLVNLAGVELSASLHLSDTLPYGREIRVTRNELPAVDADLNTWVRRLLQSDNYSLDTCYARQCSGLFTLLRPPERHFRREVCILYDLTPLILPWTHVPEIRKQFGKFFAGTSNLCDKALAISESTKADASWLCAIPTDNVSVSYPGPSLCVQSHAFSGSVERSSELILVVSTIEPRKNSRFLRDWFLTTDVLQPGAQLWWIGPKGWLSDPLGYGRKLRSRGRRFRFLGNVPDKRLCELYRRAAFTIYPSLYEGFGFPVLDSLLHGAPVVCSFNSSLQEFAGDGVLYFDACDANSLDAACSELASRLPLNIDRTDLRDRCSWDRLATTAMSLCYLDR